MMKSSGNSETTQVGGRTGGWEKRGKFILPPPCEGIPRGSGLSAQGSTLSLCIDLNQVLRETFPPLRCFAVRSRLVYTGGTRCGRKFDPPQSCESLLPQQQQQHRSLLFFPGRAQFNLRDGGGGPGSCCSSCCFNLKYPRHRPWSIPRPGPRQKEGDSCSCPPWSYIPIINNAARSHVYTLLLGRLRHFFPPSNRTTGAAVAHWHKSWGQCGRAGPGPTK